MFIYVNVLGEWKVLDNEDEIDGIPATEFYDKFLNGYRTQEFYLIKFKYAPKGTPQQILVHKSWIQLV